MNRTELAESLTELGLTDSERDALLPALAALAMRSVEPAPAETTKLIEHLTEFLPARAPVSVRAGMNRRAGFRDDLEYLFGVAASQASVLHAGFWVGSLAVLAIGGVLAASQQSSMRSLVFYLAGPLLAYLGTVLGFRAESLGVLEFEFACPVTPRQLTLARLVVIAGYQIVAGLAVTAVLAATAGTSVREVVAMWLAPLLLGTGVTLLCSLRFPIAWAGIAVYSGWVALVVLVWRVGSIAYATSLPAEAMVATVGIAAIVLTMWLLPAALPSMLNRAAARA